MEIWKDIKGYEGYQVSNLGRVRTHNKYTYTKLHGQRKWKDRILKFKNEYYSARRNKQGMGHRVDLWKDGKPHTFLVHRLVATTFLEDLINTNMTVNHKDGNRYNNNVENLEWVSRADNIIYGFENNQYQNQKSTIIKELQTNNVYSFNSMAKASMFFKKHHGFIYGLIKKGKHTFKIDNLVYVIEPF